MQWLPIALGALALSLAGIVGLELRFPAIEQEPVAQAAAIPPPTRRPPPLPDGQSTAWAAALARPLFSEDRRPPSPPLAAAAKPPPLPRLTGTIIGPFGKRALMVDESSDKPLVLGESERMGAWTVEAISEGAVTLSSPDGAQTIGVSFMKPPQTVESLQTSNAASRLRRHSRT